MFTGVNQDICSQAWEILVPAIKKAAELEILNGLVGSVVVIDPNSETGETLFTGHVGEHDPKFAQWATAKAAVTLRTGLDSVQVRQDFPHLYMEGDIKWPGAVIRDGLVVAFSGVQGEFDEMISEWMISAIRGISRDLMLRPGGAAEQDGPFLTS
ncbi:MAG: hypothetical protein CVT64_11480 [Actinobacteria bacterium HGW-Actinobacteria-4]|nr:MAG: hypothetical protein CVT64_11480 [Actinobacteria bacterium HGW-Actinobacteria-4]